ncbi:hypothetical protein [Silvimonas iriomotensis]|uniref:Uncharacterized protein n=1 Tax=Silvimonas iriomotensis TaxID=449662 RepID=A0ABQ2P7I6_9NEIS|nr:hypothetical protein [Silvimonas iriomotensis]GGP19644.1 hypothetical protein GCM10010970_11640 [Silvimonas iriomotensis]
MTAFAHTLNAHLLPVAPVPPRQDSKQAPSQDVLLTAFGQGWRTPLWQLTRPAAQPVSNKVDYATSSAPPLQRIDERA